MDLVRTRVGRSFVDGPKEVEEKEEEEERAPSFLPSVPSVAPCG